MATLKASSIPKLIYGTAWKKDQTRVLVKQALLAGFRGVDTAAQPKHYQEDLVGEGIRDAMEEAGIKREDLYIQTKFTSIHGQDRNRMPYDPSKSITNQVGTSVASSLHNLRHAENAASQPYLNCLVLHSPYRSMEDTKEAWRAMEIHVPHHAHTLGISNVYQVDVLRAIWEFASVKPTVVQNRFYADTGYDVSIRDFCDDKGMTYQSFWTLTANPQLLRSDVVSVVAESADVTKPVALYSLILASGSNISILDGTTKSQRMKEDIQGIEQVTKWSEENPDVWKGAQAAFEHLIHA